jgi:hypothetical protein
MSDLCYIIMSVRLCGSLNGSVRVNKVFSLCIYEREMRQQSHN